MTSQRVRGRDFLFACLSTRFSAEYCDDLRRREDAGGAGQQLGELGRGEGPDAPHLLLFTHARTPARPPARTHT